jgi:hypothetical protein
VIGPSSYTTVAAIGLAGDYAFPLMEPTEEG